MIYFSPKTWSRPLSELLRGNLRKKHPQSASEVEKRNKQKKAQV